MNGTHLTGNGMCPLPDPPGSRGEDDGHTKTPGPAPAKVRGPASAARARGFRRDQTAAGSSSTRRLRVRFGSTGIPGPIVVLTAAFLM
ncbi:hypothetical protein GCM10010448_14390 [Streptomyces glomeratus]|uniref:Uncharacterized protein n=1 Tax=Streptomyces glomeratus TaxID=284452 RepID=A0ABP6L709_9ACTN